MPIPVIAIFDIGKTNKKVFLFDEDLKLAFEKSETLPEITDEDGYPCEDIHGLIRWIKSSIELISGLKDFQIKAINFSAHGASLVHLDEKGKVVAPLYNYLKPFSNILQDQFDEAYTLSKVSVDTASPYLGNLNSGLQLFQLKYEKPHLFKSIRHSLHLPEFFTFLLTQKMATALPSIGCHTLLWNFEKQQYHEWVERENLRALFPPIVASNDYFSMSWNGGPIPVGIGIHDSSSALVPYLKNREAPFTLISTGTWSISLNPFNFSPLTGEELQQDCLSYLSFDGKPVKASRLLIGPQHAEQVKRMSEHFHCSLSYFESIAFDKEKLRPLIMDDGFIDLEKYESAPEAYHTFMKSLVVRQKISTGLVLKNSRTMKIYVEGGFGKNSIFMNFLAEEFKDLEVYTTELSQASALGAALLILEKMKAHTSEMPVDLKARLIR
jgi:sugar (pentulose or hexulose) kinase